MDDVGKLIMTLKAKTRCSARHLVVVMMAVEVRWVRGLGHVVRTCGSTRGGRGVVEQVREKFAEGYAKAVCYEELELIVCEECISRNRGQGKDSCCTMVHARSYAGAVQRRGHWVV